MNLKLDQMLGMRPKIIILTIAAALIPLLIVVGLSIRMQQAVAETGRDELRQLAELNALQISRDVTSLCRSAHELLLGKLDSDLKVSRNILREAGPARLSAETAEFELIVESTGSSQRAVLPYLVLGGSKIVPEQSPDRPVPVVDAVRQLTGEQCTLCVRMNEAGDMLRVASTIVNAGRRISGTGVMAAGPDGKPNPIVAKVLAGQTCQEPNTLLGEMYIAAFDPIRHG